MTDTNEVLERLRNRTFGTHWDGCETEHDICAAIAAIEQLTAQIERHAEEAKDHAHSFDLRWKADMRAIKRWQAEAPGRELIWPDHTDLCIWLMEQIERDRVDAERYRELRANHHCSHAGDGWLFLSFRCVREICRDGEVCEIRYEDMSVEERGAALDAAIDAARAQEGK